MIEKTEKEIMQNWKGDLSIPVVSIICITYNHEKYIFEAIDSFLMQETDFPFEVIIGEDCSTDRTPDIILEYAQKYPNIIKAIIRDKNIGANPNFFECVEKSSGEYIAICEGDDYWINNKKLQQQYILLNKFPDIDLCFHTVFYKDNITGLMTKNTTEEILHYRLYSLNEVIENGSSFIPTLSIMIKKNNFVNIIKQRLEGRLGSGDWVIQYYGSVHGALCIGENMGVYRTNNIESAVNMKKSFYIAKQETLNKILILKKMFKDFSKASHKSLNIQIQFTYYRLSIGYLRRFNIIMFLFYYIKSKF